jgi:hypothetical protein
MQTDGANMKVARQVALNSKHALPMRRASGAT